VEVSSLDVPPVSYAETARGKVAFQRIGEEGPVLVLVPPLAQHIEMMWEEPAFWRPLRRLAAAFRVVQYDKLGTGLSDPSSGLSTLDDRLEELEAVLDAAGIERCLLLGISEGGVIALAAAHRWTTRVEGLVLLSTFSGRTAIREAGAHGPVPTPQAFKEFFVKLVERWGSEESATLPDFVPSLRAVPKMARWMPRYERASASPKMIGALMQSGFALDAGPLLPRVEQPALVVHLRDDRVIPVACGRMLAARLPGARLLELPGDDHFAWVSPSVDAIIDAIFSFGRVKGTARRIGAVWNPWSALTPMETRVAGLACRGLTNAEIAKSLSLSLRTVENHLSRAYAKLGVRSRTELALLRRD
jgi:pimeloyl-ACP methyl ester carboxylesterase/DNA-binding CsgD family transcriptional regulator